MEQEAIRVFLQVGIGFMIVKMLFDTVVSAHIKLRDTRHSTHNISSEEWRELQQQVTTLRVEMGQVKALLLKSINGKT